jgi:transcriptional regulator with GAF, ATPase, and Fis domain
MEGRAAALEAMAKRQELEASALDPSAGQALSASAEPVDETDSDDESVSAPAPARDAVWEALVQTRGNVAQAAHALGLSRARLRRLIERWALDVGSLRGA